MTESNIEFSERLVSTAGFEVNGDPFVSILCLIYQFQHSSAFCNSEHTLVYSFSWAM